MPRTYARSVTVRRAGLAVAAATAEVGEVGEVARSVGAITDLVAGAHPVRALVLAVIALSFIILVAFLDDPDSGRGVGL